MGMTGTPILNYQLFESSNALESLDFHHFVKKSYCNPIWRQNNEKIKADVIKSGFRSSSSKTLLEMSYLHTYLSIVNRDLFLDFLKDLHGRPIVGAMRFLLKSLL